MHVTDLNHGGTRLGSPFIVPAMSTRATVPGVRTLHDPALANGREACCSFGPGLHFHVPVWSIRLQPSMQRMVMIFIVAKDRLKSGIVLHRDLTEQLGSRSSIINVGAGNQHGD